MKKYGTATPYIAAYIIMRRGNKVAFVLREHTAWMNGYYGLVAGKVEKGETYTQCAIRETKEEAGVVITEADLKYLLTVHRLDGDMDWVDVYYEATHWQGEPYNAQADEHAELAWLNIDKLPKNIIPAVKTALEDIKQGKIYSEFGWED